MLLDRFPMGWVRNHAPGAEPWAAKLVAVRKAHLARWRLHRVILDDGTDLLAIPLPGRWGDADGLRLVLTYRRGHRLLGREALLSGRDPVSYPSLCRLMDLLENDVGDLDGRPMRIFSRTMSFDVFDRRTLNPLREWTATIGGEYVRAVWEMLPEGTVDGHAWRVLEIVCGAFEARRVLARPAAGSWPRTWSRASPAFAGRRTFSTAIPNKGFGMLRNRNSD